MTEIDTKLVWFTVLQHLLGDNSVQLHEVVEHTHRITDAFESRFINKEIHNDSCRPS